MNYESQSFHPSEDSLSTIDWCVKHILPDNKALSEWHNNYVSGHKSRIALDLDIVKEKVVKGSKIIEFGSIPLVFTVALSESGYSVTGIDIAPERYEGAIGRLGINVVKCDIELEELEFENDSFDAVVFNELFEHLRINPIFTLSEVFRVLKPGGILMLSSPNLRSLDGIYNYIIRNRAFSCEGDAYLEYQKLEKLGHMGHVREYTTTEVVGFLRNIGFDVSCVIYRGGFENGIKNIIAKVFSSLRPFVSYVAEKPK